MTRIFAVLFVAVMWCATARSESVGTPESVAAEVAKPAVKSVMVIPVRDAIDKPILYVLRRGLKEAIDKNYDAVVLDMETPGGRLDVTFDIMEAMGKFGGQTVTFVNKEAISAGAFISATSGEIWFAPDGVIGAAAPVMSGGQEVDTTMKQKIVSYLKARVRATSEGKGYRGQVISAMIDADSELKIGDEVLKPKGELLSLTASEASKTYGEPAQVLLAAGIAKTVDDLLDQKYGKNNYQITRLEVTWSEELAQYINAIAPLLMGLGMLAIFIEFKTPGFGVFGATGGILLGIGFFGHYVAGLSGHEPAVIFALGAVLVLVELLFFPGVLVAALSGLAMMLGALVWSMADLWPNEPISFNGDLFLQPLINLGISLIVAIVAALALVKVLPHGWFWGRLAVGGAVVGTGQSPEKSSVRDELAGRVGVAVTGLFPSGEVEIEGRRYEARVEVGFAEAGTAVRVVRRTDFQLIVEVVNP